MYTMNTLGNFNEQRHINICPPEFRFCDKLEEVNTPTFTTDGIFRLDNRYLTNDHFIHREKKSESDKTLSRVVPEFSNNTLEVNKIDSSPFIYSPGSTPAQIQYRYPFYGWGSTTSRLLSHYEEASYFLPVSSRNSWYSSDQPQKDERLS